MSIPTKEPSLIPAEVAQLKALKRLEADLAEVTYMADIATEIVAEAFARIDLHRTLAGGKPDFYHLSEDQLNRILFSTRHAWEMARDVEKKFLSILEGPREAGEEVQP